MSKPRKKGIYERFVKRPMDFILALIVLIVLFPVLLILTIVGAAAMRGNPFFIQQRPGLNEKIFNLVKFRTMSNAKDKAGSLLPDEMRLNKYGKFLRSTSLDELPELWNILRGELSCCGPRPLLVSYLSLFNEHQKRRHEVRPGLTGYAQVHGRNCVGWEERFDMDVYYVDHITFWGDMKIIFQTVMTVLKREGISSETAATMEVFTGTKGRKPSEGGRRRKLIIIGAGGHGKVIADIAERCGYKTIAFLDEDREKKNCLDYPVVGSVSDAGKYPDYDFIVAIGNPEIRAKVQTILTQKGLYIATLIHPEAVVAKEVSIGKGTVVMAGAVVNPSSKIGEGCIINTGATVDHDNTLANYVHVSVGSHLAGNVSIGKYTWIGAGITVSNNVSVCESCMVGAGAVVVKNITQPGTYIGFPAKRIKEQTVRRLF